MRWIVALVFLVFGIVTVDLESTKWAFLGLFFFSIPVLFQFFRSNYFQYGALWVGVFMLSQTLLSPLLVQADFKTLPPNLSQYVDVKAGIPGIQGVQLITTDTKGFRITKKVNYTSNEVYKIFAIGGSTTEQIYLDDKKTWTHLLQEKLGRFLNQEVAVINTGVSGLRSQHHLATLKNIIRYNPNMVIFLTGINDWNWHIKNHFENPHEQDNNRIRDVRRLFLLRNTMLASLSNYFSKKNNDLTSIKEDYGEYYAKQRGSLTRDQQYRFKPDEVHSQYKKVLTQISLICRNHEVLCLFLTQPSGYQVKASTEFKKGFWMTPPNEAYSLDFESMVHIASLYNEYIADFANEHEHLFCDLASGIDPSYDFFYDDCHFNTKGALKVSQALYACMSSLPKSAWK